MHFLTLFGEVVTIYLITQYSDFKILAVFDRFGHLMLGSETEPRTTLEYVVFENHIAVVDGKWRLHDKVLYTCDSIRYTQNSSKKKFFKIVTGSRSDFEFRLKLILVFMIIPNMIA